MAQLKVFQCPRYLASQGWYTPLTVSATARPRLPTSVRLSMETYSNTA